MRYLKNISFGSLFAGILFCLTPLSATEGEEETSPLSICYASVMKMACKAQFRAARLEDQSPENIRQFIENRRAAELPSLAGHDISFPEQRDIIGYSDAPELVAAALALPWPPIIPTQEALQNVAATDLDPLTPSEVAANIIIQAEPHLPLLLAQGVEKPLSRRPKNHPTSKTISPDKQVRHLTEQDNTEEHTPFMVGQGQDKNDPPPQNPTGGLPKSGQIHQSDSFFFNWPLSLLLYPQLVLPNDVSSSSPSVHLLQKIVYETPIAKAPPSFKPPQTVDIITVEEETSATLWQIFVRNVAPLLALGIAQGLIILMTTSAVILTHHPRYVRRWLHSLTKQYTRSLYT